MYFHMMASFDFRKGRLVTTSISTGASGERAGIPNAEELCASPSQPKGLVHGAKMQSTQSAMLCQGMPLLTW